MMRRAPAILMALTATMTAAAAEEPTVALDLPRPNGWWIGDVLPVAATVTVDAGWTLDSASLPQPRAADYWLDLRTVDLTESEGTDGRRVYRLGLLYQTFYSPLEPKAVKVPAIPLVFQTAGGPSSVTLPAWSFVTSPIREIMAPSLPEAMLPDTALDVIDTRPAQIRAGLAVLVALAALVALAWHRAIGPFARRVRPFSRAHALVRRRLGGGNGDGEACRAAFLAVHRAFDEALGRRMLAVHIDRFLLEHPAFRPAEAEIAGFFQQSRALFFGRAGEGSPPSCARGRDLFMLTRHLARIERGRP